MWTSILRRLDILVLVGEHGRELALSVAPDLNVAL